MADDVKETGGRGGEGFDTQITQSYEFYIIVTSRIMVVLQY